MASKIFIGIFLVALLAIAGCSFNFPPIVATPTISPPGGVYDVNSIEITITSLTAGANIYYTLDGSDPVADPNIDLTYIAPFTIDATTTVKAIATRANYIDSFIASTTYTLTGVVNTPPSITLTQPLDGQEFSDGTDIVIRADVQDDNLVAGVSVFNGPTKLGDMTPLSADPQGNGIWGYTWSGASIGSHDVYAVVTDDDGASTGSNHAYISVVSTAVAPQVELIEPKTGQSFEVGSTINGMVEVLDDNINTIEIFDASIDTAPIAIATPTGGIGTNGWSEWEFTWTPALGSYTIIARATDLDGLSTDSATATIDVVQTPVSPTVTMTFPSSDVNYELGSDIQFVMSAWDDSAVTGVEVVITGSDPPETLCAAQAGLGTSNGIGTWMCSWTPSSVGTYSGIYAVATDDDGLTGESTPVTLNVVSTNVPPEVEIVYPYDQTALYINAGQAVVVDVIATDDMSIKNVEFFINGVHTGAFSEYTNDPGAGGPTHYYNWYPSSSDTSYVLTARAYDNDDVETISASVTVTVTVG